MDGAFSGSEGYKIERLSTSEHTAQSQNLVMFNSAHRAAVEAELVRGRRDGSFCVPSLGKTTELLFTTRWGRKYETPERWECGEGRGSTSFKGSIPCRADDACVGRLVRPYIVSDLLPAEGGGWRRPRPFRRRRRRPCASEHRGASGQSQRLRSPGVCCEVAASRAHDILRWSSIFPWRPEPFQ